MMEDSFEELVDALSETNFSPDVLGNITHVLEQQSSESFVPFVSQSFRSLLILEHWAWERLSHHSYQWINRPNYLTLFHTLALFNKNLIFIDSDIEDETKALLLIPDSVDQINGIFEQINKSNDDYDLLIAIISLWFDNLSILIHENPQLDTSPVICYINQYIARHYLMTDQFKLYLTQLQQTKLPQLIFSVKNLFYIKTCSFSLSSYLSARAQNFPFTPEEMLNHIRHDYLQIITTHTQTINMWSQHLLASITHLTGFVIACCWWSGERTTQIKLLLPTEQILCDFVEALIRVIHHNPFYMQIRSERSNNETTLINSCLNFLVILIRTQNINWIFHSYASLPDTLLIIAENSPFDEICLYAYSILGEILTDEKLKELQVTDNIINFLHDVLEQAWHHPLKKYKQMPILHLLRGCLSLSKSDAIKQKLADSQSITLFIEISNEYPIALDIIWSLSFNQDIQQQLRLNSVFITKLSHLAKDCDNEQMRKIINGILWNLESNHKDRSTSVINDGHTFDIMISYSHKDKVLCKQLYEELSKAGYRVWIDFDQIHGNVMDAMAEAIERSHTIIICMSEEYRKSNYCRAEAHYAFQCQRKIVPVLLQKHYKPDGWLLFLIGQLMYVDFIKYEFEQAMELLFNKLDAKEISETSINTLQSKPDTAIIPFAVTTAQPKLVLAPILPKNIIEWTQGQVQDCLTRRNLAHMSRLLVGCNGQGLLFLDDFIRNGDKKQVLGLLQDDSLRKTGLSLSLTELASFRSLMDEQRRFMEPNYDAQPTRINNDNVHKRAFICCRMM